MRSNRDQAHLLVRLLCPYAAAILAIACGDDGGESDPTASTGVMSSDSSSGGPANALPTLQVTTPGASPCSGAASVEIRATRFGCVSPPPAPCTVPNMLVADVGDALACPVEGDGTWRVEIDAAGRYYVELVSIAADGTETTECLSDTDEDFVIVDAAAFMTNPTIVLTPRGGPCPAP